ncbi:MAG TPA: chorismate pyruvate-lyase family protein [Albitalea sp.]|nr:chorismate pyruvate-lyase family protein [Albitalea sp.]
MSSNSSPSFRRDCFIDPGAGAAQAAHARHTLRLLLAQDGSTTRLCEAVAAGPITLQVLHQAPVTEVPAIVREALPGDRFIERITSLAAHGEVMMDNLTYIALQGLDVSLQRELEAGQVPIGHLLSRLWVRRESVPASPALQQRLWSSVGAPDPAATRAYRIVTPEGPRMLIAESYRRGMLMQRG